MNVSLYNKCIFFVAKRGDIYRARTANRETRIVLELSESNVIKSYYVEMESDHSEDVWAAKCAFRIAKCENVKWYGPKYGVKVDETQHVCVCVMRIFIFIYTTVYLILWE